MISFSSFSLEKLKFVALVEMGQSPPSSDYSLSSNIGLPFLQGTADFGFQHPLPRVYCLTPTKTSLPGDILFSVRAPVGTLNISDRHYGIGRGLCAIRCGDRVNQNFAWWALHWARSQLAYEVTGSTYDAVASEDVANVLIPLPSVKQQKRIADYLDRATQKIYALIVAKKRLLELLAEKRRALITQAVTRGLNPDVPLRDSGIEWLGQIPSHWNLVKIKHVATVGNGSTPFRDETSYWQDGSFPWLTSTVVNDDFIGEATEFITEVALKECHLPIVQPNSVLIAITGQGKTRGKAALLPYKATINQHMAFITPSRALLNPNFLQLFLTSVYEVLRMISEGMGSTKGALTCEQVGDFFVPLPSLLEQEEIVNKLHRQIQKIDLLSNVAAETISLLQERRTSLISAAVTGQLQIAD